MGLLCNSIHKEDLKAGDHIYSWRAAYVYAHHGVYIGNDTVVHFTRHEEEVGTGTTLDAVLLTSAPNSSRVPCCAHPTDGHGVLSSCLRCFLDGGALYRFEYSVSPVLFLAKARGGTCTLAAADQDDMVVHRSKFMLKNGFGCYNLFKNNCEDFAIYCKTGLLVLPEGPPMGQSGQIASIVCSHLAASLPILLRFVTCNQFGMATSAIATYCISRCAVDISMRRDVSKVAVEDLAARRTTVPLQMIKPQVPAYTIFLTILRGIACFGRIARFLRQFLATSSNCSSVFGRISWFGRIASLLRLLLLKVPFFPSIVSHASLKIRIFSFVFK